MTSVFISYRKADREACKTVVRKLEDAGFTVWWDNSLPGGRPFKSKIQKEIEAASIVLVLWSHNSVKSKWVYFEAEFARRMGKILPISIDRCELPPPFGDLHTHNYDPRKPDPETWATVIAEIRKQVASRDADPAGEKSLVDVYWSQVQNSHVASDVREFLTLFPKSAHAAAARARLPALEARRLSSLCLWGLIGAIMYAGILAPFLTLIADYGWPLGFYFSKLYFHYFDFFLIAGVFMIPVYLWTLAQAMGFVLSFRGLRRIAGVVCVLVIPVTVSTVASYMEISTGYAPWELNARALTQPLPHWANAVDGRTALSVFQRTDPLSTSEFSRLVSARGYHPGETIQCLAAGQAETQQACYDVKSALSQWMISLKAVPANRSSTYWSYRLGFLAFAILFIGSFFNIAIHCMASAHIRVWMARLRPWGGQKTYSTLLNLLAMQLGFISIWFVARFLFQLETSSIFPVEGSETTSDQGVLRLSYALFVGVYLVAVGGLVLAALKIYEAYARYIVVLVAILVTLVLSLTYSSSTFSQGLQTFIGVKASEISVALLVVVLFVIIFGALVMPAIFEDGDGELQVMGDDEPDPEEA